MASSSSSDLGAETAAIVVMDLTSRRRRRAGQPPARSGPCRGCPIGACRPNPPAEISGGRPSGPIRRLLHRRPALQGMRRVSGKHQREGHVGGVFSDHARCVRDVDAALARGRGHRCGRRRPRSFATSLRFSPACPKSPESIRSTTVRHQHIGGFQSIGSRRNSSRLIGTVIGTLSVTSNSSPIRVSTVVGQPARDVPPPSGACCPC